MRIGVLTVSDKCSQGLREDGSGRAILERMQAEGCEIIWYGITPDEKSAIEKRLLWLCDEQQADIILTTGGTGLAPRDVTPEATMAVAHRQAPGIAEAIRAGSILKTPMAMLSRGVAVSRGETLIINFPGSPKAVRECMEIVLPVLEHASKVLKGAAGECAAAG